MFGKRFVLIAAGLVRLSYCPPAAAEPPPQFLTTWGNYVQAYGIAVDAAGFVYVTDYQASRVDKFTDTGQFVLSWGSEGTGPGQFIGPWGITADAAGQVFVTNYVWWERHCEIEVFTSEGAFLSEFGPPGTGPGELNQAVGVAVSPSGTVYVASYGGVMTYDRSGSFLGAVGAGVLSSRALGVALDPVGNVFVSEYDGFIYKFGPTGNLLLRFGGEGTDPGLFMGPIGIAIDGAGNVYIADPGNHRIQKFSSSGSLLSYWVSGPPGYLGSPTDVAIGPDGAIYVIDGRVVQKFGYAPTPVQSVTWGAMKARYRAERGAAPSASPDR